MGRQPRGGTRPRSRRGSTVAVYFEEDWDSVMDEREAYYGLTRSAYLHVLILNDQERDLFRSRVGLVSANEIAAQTA